MISRLFLYLFNIGSFGVTYRLQGKCSLTHIDFNVEKISHFAESFRSFHYGSQKVNTNFTSLIKTTPNGR